MNRPGFNWLYSLALPFVAVAVAILGYFTWNTAAQYARLGERTILQSTTLLVLEKVDQVEQSIIRADHAVFDLFDPNDPLAFEERVAALFGTGRGKSVDAVFLFSDEPTLLAHISVEEADHQNALLELLNRRVLPELELTSLRNNELHHLHQRYQGTSHLFSYRRFESHGVSFYAVAHHDLSYMVQEVLPRLFVSEQGKRLYNVVDEDNRLVYGSDLAQAGDYIVGHRFPTTLYTWRLQVAPRDASLLEKQAKRRALTEAILLAISFVVVLIGIALLAYVASKERRLSTRRSAFIADVSHELRTPLSVIRMFSEMLLTNRVDSVEKRNRYLSLICAESERLTHLVDNVLDFTALELGKQSFQLEEGDLVESANTAVEMFRHRLEQTGCEVRIEVEGERRPLRFDPQAMLLAFNNLLDNAAKYARVSNILLRLDYRSAQEVQVEVRDWGPGIPESELQRIFDKFYRGSTDPYTRGSGIGLSLVKYIAQAHGGRSWARNAEGGGAAFFIALPAPETNKVDQDPRPPSAAPRDTQAPSEGEEVQA